ncbi:hypothetical protein NIES3275_81080 (plasmid) [Microchaete diplosiphon NIES-3275]|nr:hypothetical protein NIES3275_81080 [Microchaete diplosiphon NIES-3275]
MTEIEDFGKELRQKRSGVAEQVYEYETDKIGVLSV